MKNTIFPFTTGPGVGSTPLTEEQAKALFTEADIAAGQKRGKLVYQPAREESGL